MKKLLLIDGMAAVYRGYYAMSNSPRINSSGFNTSAALGFSNSLYDLLRSQRPTHVGVAFDLPAPTFRHQIYPEYKANRDPMPEDIQSNLPWIRRIIDAFRIPQLTCEGFEADDVIGTLAHAAELAGFDQVLMVTPDKDFAQLVTPCVTMYRYGRGKTPDAILGPADICERFDVTQPSQVIDLLGLWGDAIDNIPGIRGIGEKTAKKLIAQFGSIENMVAHLDDIKNDKLRENIRSHADDAIFSKQLATIRLDAPIAFDPGALQLQAPDYQTLKEICDQLEFRQLAKRIFTDLSVSDPSLAQQWNKKATPSATTKPQPTTASQPTLFDAPLTSTPITHNSKPIAQNWQELLHRDIAIYISGPTIAIALDADTVYTAPVSEIDPSQLHQLLADNSTLKLCHDLKNLKYILAELTTDQWTLPTDRFFDLQLTHYLVDPELRHSLDDICSSLLGFIPETTEAQAASLWQLYPLISARLNDANLLSLYNDVELPLVDVLYSMERAGIRIDTAALADYARQLAAERADIEQQIYVLAGHSFNINSPRQLGQVLYDELHITDKPPLTATKQYSTSEDVLQRFAASQPIVDLILQHRSISKLVGTYLDTFPKLISPVDHRLHTVFNQTVTATGRLSSSNPNLQNIPVRTERGREIRRAFVPADDDHLILAADYSQIELRIIASLSQDPHMLQAFNSGLDIHAATAARVYHLPVEQVTADQRRNAKSVNFGIVYGISPFGLSQQLSIPRKEAAALIDEYFAQYPAIADFIEQCKEFARTHGYARTLLGRRRYLPDINSRNNNARSFAERNAVNMPVQGTSADMIKIAMVRIYNDLQRLKLRSRLLIQVHDELVFDLYRPEEEQLRALVVDAMQNALPLEGLTAKVSVDIAGNWLDAH